MFVVMSGMNRIDIDLWEFNREEFLYVDKKTTSIENHLNKCLKLNLGKLLEEEKVVEKGCIGVGFVEKS